MRDFAEQPNKDPKWIVLDGDIDPDWIESLNTVMDDNKVLTLASNERIPLHPWMRLVFEIGHLKYANPSTVSRAGILFVNEVCFFNTVRVAERCRPILDGVHLYRAG